MSASHRRHDLSDRAWACLEPHLPGAAGKVGRPALDNRLFLNAVLWILRTGAPWRALPPDYGDWKNTHRRFSRWRDRGVWQRLLYEVIDDPDWEWLIPVMSKSIPMRLAGEEAIRRWPAQRGLNTKLHLAVDSHGMPVRLLLTKGTTADCSQAMTLIDGIGADRLLADRGHDSNEVVEAASSRGMNLVIPPRSNRKKPRDYDRGLHKLRHLVGNVFLHLKQRRGVATRYAKEPASFLAICQTRALVLWTRLF